MKLEELRRAAKAAGADIEDEYRDDDAGDLMHKVWSPTPWVVDVFTGPGHPDPRDQEILRWCYEHFGEQSSPIHGVEGVWRRGNATIYGWTWYGFATRELMEKFQEAWPDPVEAAP